MHSYEESSIHNLESVLPDCILFILVLIHSHLLTSLHLSIILLDCILGILLHVSLQPCIQATSPPQSPFLVWVRVSSKSGLQPPAPKSPTCPTKSPVALQSFLWNPTLRHLAGSLHLISHACTLPTH
jgi:hypothetical protein